MPTLKELRSEIDRDPVYSKLTPQAWEAKIRDKTIDAKFDDVLSHVATSYVRKITLLREQIAHPTIDGGVDTVGKTLEEIGRQVVDSIQSAITKEKRLLDKLACVLKEQDLRAKHLVERTPHHTDYYIDYDNGNDGNTGLSTGQAWKTITKYTTDTVRSAGDIAYLRANITWDQGTEATDIEFDEDGTVDAYISIIGCGKTGDGDSDPWGDDDATKPIIDFEDAAYQMYAYMQDYWWLERVDIRRGEDVYGHLYLRTAIGWYIKGCDFSDSTKNGIRTQGTQFTLDDCTFADLHTLEGQVLANQSYGCEIVAKDCTFNHGAGVGSDYAIVIRGGQVYCHDCSFGDTTQFDNGIFHVMPGGAVYMRNCTYTGTLTAYSAGGAVYSEDDDGTFESHVTTFCQGTITRDTGTVRSGGADSSAKMAPTADCGPNNPLILGDRMWGFRPIWATKDVEITVTVYARVGTAWDTALEAGECYAKFSYLRDAVTAERTVVQSAQQISNNPGDENDGWTALTSGAITPLQTGLIYVWLYLAEYEDPSEHIFVDIKPTVT